MATDQETFEALEAAIKCYYPKFRVIAKSKSPFHRFIGAVLKPVNSSFMTRFWTTFGATTAYPTEKTVGDHYSSWQVLPHEGLHAGQAKHWTSFLFGLLYLLGTPVYLVLGLLVALPLIVCSGCGVSGVPWWASLVAASSGLVLSCPVPFAYWRYHWELHGYWISMAVWKWTGNTIDDSYLASVAYHFTSGEYFYMWPFKKAITAKLQVLGQTTARLFEDSYYGQYMASIYRTLKDQKQIV